MIRCFLWVNLRLIVVLFVVSFSVGQVTSQTIFDGWREVPGSGTTLLPDTTTVYRGKLHLFGVGIGDHAHYMNVFDGVDWTGWKPVPGGGTTSLPDSAAVYRDKLYLFAIGAGDHAHYMNVLDGAQWSGWSLVPGGGTTSLSDSATVYRDQLYLFGIGIGDLRHYLNIFDGAKWSGWLLLPGGGTTSLSDSATVYRDKLYLFGIGTGDHKHYVNILNGSTWSGWSLVSDKDTTSVAVTAVVYRDKLYLFAIGKGDSAHYVNILDGAKWSGWSPVQGGGTTSVADAAVSYAGKLYLFAIGTRDHRHYLNVGVDQAPAQTVSPHFDEVFRKGTHNSYWVNNKSFDPGGAGPQMRLWDQLVHEHVRSIELDLHRDIDDPRVRRGYHPGEYRVYHTNEPENSTCFSLADCLQLLQRLDYVLPDHEVVHIALELKQVDRFFTDEGLFDDSNFRPEEIDRLLWEHLGSRLYTPAEFLSRCNPIPLRHCAAAVGWPTVDQLRGRYIVTIHGTKTDYAPGASNERSWWQYASADIRTRAAFPMYVVSDTVTDDQRPAERANRYGNQAPEFINMWRKVLDNTIFFQLENIDNPDFLDKVAGTNDPHVPLHRQFHGVVRSKAAHLVDHEPNGSVDNVGSIMQTTAVSRGWQILMTDYPANFIQDVRAQDSPRIASRVDRPFFETADVGLADTRRFSPDALREPGSRLYFDTANRFLEHDLLNDTGLSRTTDPNKVGKASFVRAIHPRESEPVEDWEFFPATSMVGHSKGPLQTTPFGAGCFFASTNTFFAVDEMSVCRAPDYHDDRSVSVSVNIWKGRVVTYTQHHTVPHHLLQGAALGDALRVRVDRSGDSTVVSVFTAAEANPDGTMRWLPWADGPFTFQSDLAVQGFFQNGDGVFAGTRLNGKLVSFADFAPEKSRDGEVRGFAYDLSFCLDGSCREKPLPSHESIFTRNGVTYIGVHETEGPVYGGQWRTLLTSDRFEVISSGLYQFQRFNKFVLLRDAPLPGAPMTLLFKCVDWRRDYHQHWVSTDPSCPNPNTKEPFAQSGGTVGYIATTMLPGTHPLWHVRKGTRNAGSADTHDHYFAVGDAERDVKLNIEGYKLVGSTPVGWVYTKETLP